MRLKTPPVLLAAFFLRHSRCKMNIQLKKLICVLVSLLIFSVQVKSETFESIIEKFPSGSNKEKSVLIEDLYATNDPRVLPVLSALLDARLYYTKADSKLIYMDKVAGELLAVDVLEGIDLGPVDKKSIKKIRITNKLRRLLRIKIAVLELASDDEKLRLKSAQNFMKSPNSELRDVIVDSIAKEAVSSVSNTLNIALALIDIKGTDNALRMTAIDILSQSVEPQAVGALNAIIATDEEGQYIEADLELVQAAELALKSVNSKLGFYKFSENLLFGLSLGSILLLAAIGLAITFGVMGVINMAHGEMIMLGAYTTFAVQQLFPSLINVSLFIAIPAAFLVAGSVGMLIERLVIRHLYGRPLDTLLATFGISLILQQAVRTYSSNSVSVVSPEWISGAWQINGAIALTYNRIYILFFSLIVLAVLALILKKTLVGLQMRAVTQNRAMANSMGIKSSWVDALTFGLGSGIAGIAGVALSQIDSVSPNLGQAYIVDTFMVVVFGGVGNILGTFFGAMSLGVLNKFLEPYTGAVIGKILVLVFIILFIQWRPRGLFALKGRFVED